MWKLDCVVGLVFPLQHFMFVALVELQMVTQTSLGSVFVLCLGSMQGQCMTSLGKHTISLCSCKDENFKTILQLVDINPFTKQT